MASGIDSTKPVAGNASTSNVRANFSAAETEINELQRATEDSVTAAGTADVLTANFTTDVILAEGITVVVLAASANATTTPTLNVDGTGAETIVKDSGTALLIGDIAGNRHYMVLRHDSTNNVWVLMNPAIIETFTASSLYPVGSVYMNATNATNPGTLLGFGTWVEFAKGRVPVGLDSADTDFDTAEETGGNKDVTGTSNSHTLTVAQMPAHTHGIRTSGNNDPGSSQDISNNTTQTNLTDSTGGGGGHTHGISLTKEALQPYITVHMWKRTA